MSGMFPIIFILLAVALVVGPVMMLQPTATERRLAKLRSKAAMRGLRVKADLEEKSMKYILPWGEAFEFEGEFSIKRHAFAHDIHFHGNWVLQLSELKLSRFQNDGLKDMTSKLEDITCFGANSYGVYVNWTEKQGNKNADECIDNIESILSNLRNLFTN